MKKVESGMSEAWEFTFGALLIGVIWAICSQPRLEQSTFMFGVFVFILHTNTRSIPAMREHFRNKRKCSPFQGKEKRKNPTCSQLAPEEGERRNHYLTATKEEKLIHRYFLASGFILIILMGVAWKIAAREELGFIIGLCFLGILLLEIVISCFASLGWNLILGSILATEVYWELVASYKIFPPAPLNIFF